MKLEEYLNLLDSSLGIMKGELAWRMRYSTSPTSPFNPMFLQPYGAPARIFSGPGLEKKSLASSSTWEIIPCGTPWLITLKKPYSSQAVTISFMASDRLLRFMIGSSMSSRIFMAGFWDITTICVCASVLFDKIMEVVNEDAVLEWEFLYNK